MEEKNPQKSITESNLFKIPIEKYEKAIETKPTNPKKKEILDLLNNHNKLRSEEEFKEISNKLYDACKYGDLDLIKIYLSETVENNSHELQFKIDSTNRTASLIKVRDDIIEAVIPRTVEHESVEYLITSITGTSEKIKTLKFVEDSAVKTIYRHAFPYSSQIKEINFPASLKELKEDWCFNINNLNKITISPSNNHFKIEENKYLVGKSDSNKDEFDILFFACRDIDQICIPSNIKIISSNAFQLCRNLSYVGIPKDSNLQIIKSSAFEFTNIKEIFIPSKVSKISEYAFAHCNNLTNVDIPIDSNLQTIESCAFEFTKIREIYFPASLKELKDEWCSYTEKLIRITISPMNSQFMIKEDKYLVGKSDSNKDEFDILLFAFRCIKDISIPSNIKIISPFAFYECIYLTEVKIPKDSNLQIIGSKAFSYSNIYEILIPSKVSIICESAFSNCDDLIYVEIPIDSNLQTIESNAFSSTKINEIYFPASLKELKEDWCDDVNQLTKITISPSNRHFKMKENKYLVGKSNDNNDEFDILLFAKCDTNKIFIPSNIKTISSYAFQNCINLTKVEFPIDSKLRIIEEYLFYESNIKEIYIPSTVLTIKKRAFSCCINLKKVEIPINSNLQIIESYAFSSSYINKIFIPSNVSIICDNAFSCCRKLTHVEIPANSNLEIIDVEAFKYSNIEEIFIPSKVSRICEYAFGSCRNLKIVEISEESKLESFPLMAFNSYTHLMIMIPTSLEKLINK